MVLVHSVEFHLGLYYVPLSQKRIPGLCKLIESKDAVSMTMSGVSMNGLLVYYTVESIERML